MAREAIPVQVRQHLRMNTEPGSATLTWTDGDATSGHSFALTGREMLLVRNTDTVMHFVRIHGASDAFGRSGTTGNYAVAAGAIAVFAVSPLDVWAQSGNVAWVDVESDAIKLAVVRYP